MSYAEKGEQQKAITMYQESIKLSDTYPQTHYNLANSYADLGDITLAENEYYAALSKDPYFYLAYFRLFTIYKMQNNIEKQTAIINRVRGIVAENPSFQPVLLQLEQAQ